MERKIILLSIVVFILVTSILGCASEIHNEIEEETESEVPEFSQSYSSRDELYPVSFKVYSAEDEELKLSIGDTIYDPDEAAEFYKYIKEDINLVANVFGDERIVPVSFYLVEEPYAGGCYARGNRVYCTIEDVREKNYRMALMQACLSLTEPWMVEGATVYVFGEKPDDEVLLEYYASTDDIDILSLFGAYFYHVFASEQEMKIAKDTAASLATYIIDEHGINSFLESYKTSYRQKWLGSIGVDREYSDEHRSTLDGLLYSYTKDYPLIINADEATFYFQIIPENMVTVEQVKTVVTDALEGSELIMEHIRVNAPRNYERLKDNPAGVKFYFMPELPGGYMGGLANADFKEIEARHARVVIHELTHIIIPRSRGNKSIWQFEGIAEYFNYDVYPTYTNKEIYYKYYLTDYASTDEVLSLCQDYYLKHAPFPEDPQDMDLSLIIEAIAVTTLTHPELYREDSRLFRSVLEIAGRRENGSVGNELTYEQSYLFISYLIDNYSLDTVLDYCQNNADFEAIFGDSYEDLKAQWIDSITKDN